MQTAASVLAAVVYEASGPFVLPFAQAVQVPAPAHQKPELQFRQPVGSVVTQVLQLLWQVNVHAVAASCTVGRGGSEGLPKPSEHIVQVLAAE